MLVLLDDIRYFLREDLQIDYPQRFYKELENTERIPFDFWRIAKILMVLIRIQRL